MYVFTICQDTSDRCQDFTEIKVGASNETFRVILDTASNGILLFVDSTTQADGDVAIDLLPGVVELTGRLSRATVQIGDIAIRNQDVAWTSQRMFGNIDGIFGLSHSPVGPDDTPTPLYNMIEQGLLDEPVFAVYLSRPDDPDGDSVLTLGGSDESRFFGNPERLPVRGEAFWEVRLDSIAFGNAVVHTPGSGAILDTGTTLLVLPTSLAQIWNSNIGAVRDEHGQFRIDCGKRGTLPALTFTLVGHEFSLDADDYIVEVREDSCVSAVIGFDIPEPDGPLVVLGAPFLRRWYSIYDLGTGSVWLAKAR